MRLRDFADVNPSVPLERGKEYPFMDMANVTPLSRSTKWPESRTFTGSGARFDEGDTLFARITPCLENGKITQARNLEKPGFGSTEFYILRGKKEISDNDFVFYLARTHKVRKLAEQNMIGASGRQRVERTAFENISVSVPEDVEIQKRIAGVLSTFDEKIENNNRIIKTLEEMAQATFKAWFVKRTNLETTKLGEVVELVYGKALKEENREGGDVVVVGSSGIVGQHNEALVKGPGIVVGRKGIAGSVIWIDADFYPIDTTYYVKTELPLTFCFYMLRRLNFLPGDSAVPGLNREDAYRYDVVVPAPGDLKMFDELVKPMFEKRKEVQAENEKLAAMRDLLLPRLMNGEIKI